MSDIQERVHFDSNGTTYTIERIQDVEAILEANKRLRSQSQKSDWGRHVATVPNVILERWLNEEWQRGNCALMLGSDEFNRIVKRKLQDPEWQYLRTDK